MLLQAGQIAALACVLLFDRRQLLAIGMRLTAAPVQHLLAVRTRTIARQMTFALATATEAWLQLLRMLGHALMHLMGSWKGIAGAPARRLEVILLNMMLLKNFDRMVIQVRLFTAELLRLVISLLLLQCVVVIVGERNRSDVLGRRGLEHASSGLLLVLLVATALLLVHYAD